MEWLGNFFQANTSSLITLIALIIVVLFAARRGLFSVNIKGIKVGQDIETRNLIQAQWEYANAKVEGMIARLPDNLDVFHTKYVLARVEQQVSRMIIFNNMSTEEDYIKSKQELVYETIMKRVTDNWFKTPDFRALVYEFTEDLIRDLVRMKRAH